MGVVDGVQYSELSEFAALIRDFFERYGVARRVQGMPVAFPRTRRASTRGFDRESHYVLLQVWSGDLPRSDVLSQVWGCSSRFCRKALSGRSGRSEVPRMRGIERAHDVGFWSWQGSRKQDRLGANRNVCRHFRGYATMDRRWNGPNARHEDQLPCSAPSPRAVRRVLPKPRGLFLAPVLGGSEQARLHRILRPD